MRPTLRVTVVIDDLRVAGAQRVLAEEARAFDPCAVALQVVALADPPGRSLASEIASSGVPITYAVGRGLLDVRRIIRLARLIRSQRANLVHTHLTYANILGGLAAGLARRPLVASMHGLTTDQPRFNEVKRMVESIILRSLADPCIVVSKSALDETSRNFRLPRDRIELLPNALDLGALRIPASFDRAAKRRELGVAPGDKAICTIARLDPDKGHRVLLGVAETLSSRHPRARYLFVGAGRAQQELQEVAAAARVAQRVSFLGVREDVPEILAASDLFVLPSLSETYSVAVREAMALGTPVVATRLPGIVEVVVPGETGWLVRPGEPGELASAIDEALSDPQRAATCAERARKFIQDQCAVGPHIARLEAIYRNVVERAGRTLGS